MNFGAKGLPWLTDSSRKWEKLRYNISLCLQRYIYCIYPVHDKYLYRNRDVSQYLRGCDHASLIFHTFSTRNSFFATRAKISWCHNKPPNTISVQRELSVQAKGQKNKKNGDAGDRTLDLMHLWRLEGLQSMHSTTEIHPHVNSSWDADSM